MKKLSFFCLFDIEKKFINNFYNIMKNKKIKPMTLAFFLNLSFSILEFVGGILTNSTAIMMDAIHDFTDAVAIWVAVFMEKVSDKNQDEKFSFGYKRFSMLSGLLMSLFLVFWSVFMVYHSVLSFLEPQKVHSLGMLGLAILGIWINGFAVWKMKNGGEAHHHHAHWHSHSHSHSHWDSHSHSHDEKNFNNKAVMLHLLEDVLGWVAVLLGAVVIYFTNWFWVDGLLAILIAIYVFYNASKNIISIMKILLQSVPENIKFSEIREKILNIEGVLDIHNFHIWSLDGTENICSLHIEVAENTDEKHIFEEINTLLEKNNITHSTLQMEKGSLGCKKM